MLNDGGVMAQWMPLYQLSVADYAVCVNSFAAAFDNVAMIFTGTDTVLLGTGGEFTDEVLTSPYLIAVNDDIRDYFGEYGVNTEDKLTLEYTAPRSLYEFHQDEILAELIRIQNAPAGSDAEVVKRIMQAKRCALLGDLGKAEEYADAAYELGGADWDNNDLVELNGDIAFEQAWVAMERGEDEEAIAYFERVLYYKPDSEAARFNIEYIRSY
jgi:tetratricopeptide (TPR) repeat protein